MGCRGFFCACTVFCSGLIKSILKEISPGCSLEALMLKVKLQHFGHLMWIVDSLEKTLMLGGIGGRRRRGRDGWMASPTRWTWVWVDSGSWWWTGRPGVLQFMGLQSVGHDWATELNWTERNWIKCNYLQIQIFLVKLWTLTSLGKKSKDLSTTWQ